MKNAHTVPKNTKMGAPSVVKLCNSNKEEHVPGIEPLTCIQKPSGFKVGALPEKSFFLNFIYFAG